ncbi:DUF5317 domain-containing protein [Kineosporia sp. J2-2]|uniref:DUF5317 domain-containing protein n=1 Tax=Kineosporia corallincola TaxID=2835133 RepID=A0ABS5TSH7_9ACTN|nr:DUF5317 domain-containing protein [Kineosporia corallincola]MBT0773763.1 DUF5317 domain-containing protein [Kineosporia corallincola]
MIVGVLALLLVLLVPLTGGSLLRLGQIRIRAWGLLVVALAAQVLVFSVFPELPGRVGVSVHLLTYALAGGFLWLNRSVRGIWLIALGALLNGLAILVNGGTLPSSEWATRTAGLERSGGFANSAVLPDPHLLWLGDVLAVPAGVPFANVFSVGDVLIVIGVGVLVLAGSRGPATTPRTSPSSWRSSPQAGTAVPGAESSAVSCRSSQARNASVDRGGENR